jgi:hypothetical protein
MKIVIDIPEDYYKAIKEIPVEQSTADMMIIRKGTPLPEIHGRLIDGDALLTQGEVMYGKDDQPYLVCRMDTIINALYCDTLIEADKEESGGER